MRSAVSKGPSAGFLLVTNDGSCAVLGVDKQGLFQDFGGKRNNSDGSSLETARREANELVVRRRHSGSWTSDLT